MDDRERDTLDDLARTVNVMSQDIAIIKATQPNLAETLKSFTTLYTTLDTRVRKIESAGHECKNTAMLHQFMTFMIEQKGVQKGRAPTFSYLRDVSLIVASAFIGMLITIVGGGGK